MATWFKAAIEPEHNTKLIIIKKNTVFIVSKFEKKQMPFSWRTLDFLLLGCSLRNRGIQPSASARKALMWASLTGGAEDEHALTGHLILSPGKETKLTGDVHHVPLGFPVCASSKSSFRASVWHIWLATRVEFYLSCVLISFIPWNVPSAY